MKTRLGERRSRRGNEKTAPHVVYLRQTKNYHYLFSAIICIWSFNLTQRRHQSLHHHSGLVIVVIIDMVVVVIVLVTIAVIIVKVVTIVALQRARSAETPTYTIRIFIGCTKTERLRRQPDDGSSDNWKSLVDITMTRCLVS